MNTNLAEVGRTIAEHKHLFKHDELALLRLLYINQHDFTPVSVIHLDLGINEGALLGNDGLRNTISKKLFRLTGWKLVSNSKGYRITNDPKVWAECERTQKAHAISELQTTQHLKEPKEEAGLFQ